MERLIARGALDRFHDNGADDDGIIPLQNNFQHLFKIIVTTQPNIVYIYIFLIAQNPTDMALYKILSCRPRLHPRECQKLSQVSYVLLQTII